MTPAQIIEARSLLGKMDRRDIAKEVGASLSSLKRAFRGTRMAFHNKWAINPALVRRIGKFYSRHGMRATEEAFPGVSVRSVVEHYKDFKPRQIRWTDTQITEAARMAGLVSPMAQAKYFNRPRAHVGSIRSLWMKKFGMGWGQVNGMVHHHAKHLVDIKARYLRPVGESRHDEQVQFRRLILWVDMEKCLKPEVPTFMKDAIHTMADFQRWLHGSSDPRKQILRMIKEREVRA